MQPIITTKRPEKPFWKIGPLALRPIQQIGLVAGIVVGAVFAHFEYGQWFYGALVGS